MSETTDTSGSVTISEADADRLADLLVALLLSAWRKQEAEAEA